MPREARLRRRGTRRAAVGLAALAAVGGAAIRGALTFRSSPAERRATLPGDRTIVRPDVIVTRSIEIDAPPDHVWPWLVQVGWHRGGWYTPRWVDQLLFPTNAASADRIIPAFQHLAVGDTIPDGAPESECGFIVEELVKDRVLVLRSRSHLPLAWRRRGWAAVDWTWTFVLEPAPGGRTRLRFRWRLRARPWWLRAAAWLVVVPADAYMADAMLRGIKGRAESPAPADILVFEPRRRTAWSRAG